MRGSIRSHFAILAFFLATAPALAGGDCAPQWDRAIGLPGTSGAINALASIPSGPLEGLYAGGLFNTADGIPVSLVARWDGLRWNALAEGMTGVDDQVAAMCVFDDGSGPKVCVAGNVYIGPYNTILCWDGVAWTSALSFPTSGGPGTILSLTAFNDGGGNAIFAGGVGGVYRVVAGQWERVGGAFNNLVYSLAVHDDGSGPALFAGGAFTSIAGATVNRVAKWNGTQWVPLALGVSDAVRAMTSYNDGGGLALIVGGSFSVANQSTPVFNLARWRNGTWSEVGGGTNGRVLSLGVHDDGTGAALFVGGEFTMVSRFPANRIAKWNGSQWSALAGGASEGLFPTVNALVSHDDGLGPSLFAAGRFLRANGLPSNRIARWGCASDDQTCCTDIGKCQVLTPESCRAWPGDVREDVDCAVEPACPATVACCFEDDVCEDVTPESCEERGGAPHSPASACSSVICDDPLCTPHWDTSPGIPGAEEIIEVMAVYDDGAGPGLHVGGFSVDNVGGVYVRGLVARLRQGVWASVGREADCCLNAMVGFDDGTGPALYLGGTFERSGGVLVDGIARWKGANFTALGSGLKRKVDALAVHDDGNGPMLYAGGRFAESEGAPGNRIAKWNGAAWEPLGAGLGGSSVQVNVMASYDGGDGPELYVGGRFETAGGLPVTNIARWDGAEWHSVGVGISAFGAVYGMHVWDDGNGPALYVVGAFSLAGGVVSNSVAKWNGTAWSPLGTGLSSPGPFSPTGHAVASYRLGSKDALYVAGTFGAAGGVAAKNIARWDGSTWAGLGGGVDGFISPLVPGLQAFDDGKGPALFAGGAFLEAGGQTVFRLAAWRECPGAPCLGRRVNIHEYQRFAACHAGPGASVGDGCGCYDFNGGGVSLSDFAELARSMTEW